MGNWKNNKLTEIGIAISISGVPLGMYLNYFLGSHILSEVLMVLSLLLIPNYKNLLGLRFYVISPSLYYILTFQLICVGYMVYSELYTYCVMHFYLILLVVFLSFRGRDGINVNCIINYIFFITSVCSILGGLLIYKGLIVGEEAWLLSQENENYVLEIFTASFGAVLNFSCAIYFLSKNKYILISVFLLLLDLYIIFMGGKRSPFIVVIMIYFLWMFFSTYRIKKYLAFCSFILVVCLFFVGFSNEFFSSYVVSLWSNTISGLQVLFGNVGNVVDQSGSASFRVGSRNWAYDVITNNFDFLNYLFGYGYMTRWLDNPMLQSYLDMGVYGLLSFFLIVIYLPVYNYIVNRNSMEVLVFFSFCLYAILTCMSSGHPYLSIKYIPVIVLIFVVFCSKKGISNSIKC